MTLIDTNLLLYATFADTPEHRAARSWLEAKALDTNGGIVLCWPVLYAFVRLASSPRTFGARALSVAEAWSDAIAFLSLPASRVVSPGPGHRSIATELASTPGLRSADVPDVEIAALTIEHGLVLATRDHGFRRFSGLRLIDPLS